MDAGSLRRIDSTATFDAGRPLCSSAVTRFSAHRKPESHTLSTGSVHYFCLQVQGSVLDGKIQVECHKPGLSTGWVQLDIQFSLVKNRGSRGCYALPRITVLNPGVDEAISSYKRFPAFETTFTKDTGRDGDVAKYPHLD